MSTKTTYCIANYFFLVLSVVFFSGAFFCALTKCDPPKLSNPVSAGTINVTNQRDSIKTNIILPVMFESNETLDQFKILGLDQLAINRHCESGEFPGVRGDDGNWSVSVGFLRRVNN